MQTLTLRILSPSTIVKISGLTAKQMKMLQKMGVIPKSNGRANLPCYNIIDAYNATVMATLFDHQLPIRSSLITNLIEQLQKVNWNESDEWLTAEQGYFTFGIRLDSIKAEVNNELMQLADPVTE